MGSEGKRLTGFKALIGQVGSNVSFLAVTMIEVMLKYINLGIFIISLMDLH